MNQLGRNIGERILRKRFGRIVRNKSVQNFGTAQSAVILFDTSLPDGFPPIKEFKKFLKDKGIKTRVIGFVEKKEIPQEMLLWPNVDFITRKEISWYGSPKGEVADAYYSNVPDLLFSICFKPTLSMEYLVQLSRAKFKIGCYTELPNDLDLMINPPAKDCRVDYFIEQVKHYINLLNPSN